MAVNYLGYSYTIEGTTVKVTPCYYATILTMHSDYTLQCFVPVEQPEFYNFQVTSYWSPNEIECDYNSVYSYSFIPLSASIFSQNTNSIFLAPNPCNGQLIINSENISINSIKICNSLGQLVKTSQVLQNDVSDLENGIYHLVLETKIGSVTRTLMVKN